MTATVRVMSAEEIAARGGGEVPFLRLPQRTTLFAERAMRLRQLARGHSMGDFLLFMAELALAQQQQLSASASLPLPDATAIDQAAKLGVPPLPATDWLRDPAWRDTLRVLIGTLRPRVPATAQGVIDALLVADDDLLERQADSLLHGVMAGVDLAAAPLIAAGLQVHWTRLVLAVQAAHTGSGQPFGRIDDNSVCPCCGSKPTASVIHLGGEMQGQRYLQCSLCSTQWHRARIECTHCGSGKHIAFQSLQAAESEDGSAAALAVVMAETCDDCHHYLKLMHGDRDPSVDAVADDLASVTLDLLVAESGWMRHGVNLMLLFGEPDAAADPPDPRPA